MPPRTSPRVARTMGEATKQSRAQAEVSKERTVDQQKSVDVEGWPQSTDGRPLIKITMTASELIPTGQFANISIGPAQITAFIDPQDDTPFADVEKRNIANAVNILAEIVEQDVVAIQRNLVLESMQSQISNGS